MNQDITFSAMVLQIWVLMVRQLNKQYDYKTALGYEAMIGMK